MPIKWKTNRRFNPDVILARINESRKTDPNHGVLFSGFGVSEHIPTLSSMLIFPEASREIDTSSFIWKALTRTPEPITKSSFLKSANDLLDELLSSKQEKYVVLSEISVRKGGLPAKLTHNSVTIHVLEDFPKKYKSRGDVIKDHFRDAQPETRGYLKLSTHIKAKSPTAAVNRAIATLDIHRGIMCLLANHQMQYSLGGHIERPINVIRYGRFHTVHLANGSPAANGTWYERNFTEAPPHIFKESQRSIRSRQTLLSKLNQCKYKNDLENAISRYAQAFDEPDSNTAFLRLWSCLEALTTPNIADYEKLVRRCSFLYKDHEYHTQVLEHLREYRNSSMHLGKISDDARILSYQLQGYFRQLVIFHLVNAPFFKSLEEANDFLDTPPNKAIVSRSIQLAKKAQKFLS